MVTTLITLLMFKSVLLSRILRISQINNVCNEKFRSPTKITNDEKWGSDISIPTFVSYTN